MDIEKILQGLPIKYGKTLYAEAKCPCCGREWFARADTEVFSIAPVCCTDGKVTYVGNVTCDNCNYTIEQCDLIDEEAVIERCKSYTEEDQIMLENYILTGDGEEYVDVECVREALGIVDEHADVLRAIRKLREEKDAKINGLKADLELTNKLYREDRNFIEKVCEAVDVQRPYLERGYDKAVKLIAEIKKERDELKEKCNKLKARTNAMYGASCGYSASKEPAFRCNVISYSWEFSPIVAQSLMDEPSYRLNNDSIRVELDLTPNANYKGSFDLEDLKKYIQAYGREKKLGVIESVDYQNAKVARAEPAYLYKQVLGKDRLDRNLSPVARAELSYLYKQVLGKDRLDRNLSPHEVMKAIHDEYKKVRDSQFAFSQSLRSVYMHIYEGTGYDVSDIYADPDKIADWIMTRYDSTKNLGHAETLCDINDFIDELCDKYNVVQPRRSYTTRERLDYIFSVLSENRERYNSEWKWVEQLKKEKQALIDSLVELRAKIREIYRSIVDDEWDESLGYTSALNDINEEYKRVVHNFEERTADWSKVRQEFDRYKLAVGSLCNIPAEHREDISWIEDSFNYTKKEYLKWQTTADKLARLRSNICTSLCLGCETSDEDILERVHKTRECHDKLCKDYTELRKAIWESMDRKPETLPDETARLVGEVAELKRGEKLLIEFRDSVAKAMGMDYPTTNNYILKRVSDIYKAYGETHDIVTDLDRKCINLTAKNSELESKYKEQYCLRQQWHVRYESEHERANGVQKALDREREKCRVKDISLETAKKQYEKVCINLETAECALNGMKSKVRKLREENAVLKKDIAELKREETDGTADTDD